MEGWMSELTTVLSEAFDIASEEGTPAFEPLPAGTYVAVVNDVKVGPLKSGRGQAVQMTWEIEGDKYSGRLIWDRIIVVHDSADAMRLGRQKFKDLAVACGIKDAVTDLSVMHGKRCMIFVKIEVDPNGEYPPKNKVVRIKPIAAAPPKTNGKADFNDQIPF
jgi:Protein of unknown function (DUF669)